MKEKIISLIPLMISMAALVLIVNYITHTNKHKSWLIGDVPDKVWAELQDQDVSQALNLSFEPTEEDLSRDGDNVRMVREAKEALFYFNIEVTEFQGLCSNFHTEPCSFYPYRAYDPDYENLNGVKDHASGYAVDLKLPDISRGQIKGHNTGNFMLEKANEYGFILEYEHEPNRSDRFSHFRYVGYHNAMLIGFLDTNLTDYLNSFKGERVYANELLEAYFFKSPIKNNKVRIPENLEYKIYQLSDSEALIVGWEE